MTENKEKFYEALEAYYSNGIFKEVYSSDSALVCNILDKLYVAFNLDVMDYSFEAGYPGFVVNTKGLKEIVNDPLYIHTHYQNLTPQMQKDYLIVLNDKFLNHMITNKEKIKNKPPNPELDLVFESQLISEQARKKELASMFEAGNKTDTMVHQNTSHK